MTKDTPVILGYITLDVDIPYTGYQTDIDTYILGSSFIPDKIPLDVARPSPIESIYSAGRGAKAVDTNYEVIPIKDNVFKSPTTILALAAERG